MTPSLPLSSSAQSGKPGHCFAAQIFDNEGKHLAMVDPTEDPEVATEVARVFAASYDMLDAIRLALRIDVDKAAYEDENWLIVHAMSIRKALEDAYRKATI
jgi:hypothetical protein